MISSLASRVGLETIAQPFVSTETVPKVAFGQGIPLIKGILDRVSVGSRSTVTFPCKSKQPLTSIGGSEVPFEAFTERVDWELRTKSPEI